MRRLRVSAYGVCVQDGLLLLARWVSSDGSRRQWTMPGGGLEHGEDPLDAVVREVAEETGYDVAVQRLLGVDSKHRPPTADRPDDDFHALRFVYDVRVTGGALRHETGGSTDRAEWFAPEKVPGLDRFDLVDVALALHEQVPPTGRPPKR